MLDILMLLNPLMLITPAFAVAALSITIARSSFTNWLRDILDKRIPIIGKLLSCPYCVSHWVAFGISFWMFYPEWPLLLFATFALVGASALIIGVIMRLFLSHEDEIEHLRRIIRDFDDPRVRCQ
jgi:hypothetical protein